MEVQEEGKGEKGKKRGGGRQEGFSQTAANNYSIVLALEFSSDPG